MAKNVLLITADQFRGDCLWALGHDFVKTPHLDALASNGALFRNHYCQATPCSPARASLLPGLYQLNHRMVRNGTPLDRRHDNLARMVCRHGHDPVLFGYTDQTRDPRETAGDDPWVATFEGVLPGFRADARGGVMLDGVGQPWRDWLVGRGVAVPAKLEDLFFPTRRFTLIPAHGRLSTRRVLARPRPRPPFWSTVFSPIWRGAAARLGSPICRSCARIRRFACRRPVMGCSTRPTCRRRRAAPASMTKAANIPS